MCFRTLRTKEKARVIDKNITAFKIFRKTPKGTLISPYRRHSRWAFDKFKTSDLIKEMPDTGHRNIHTGLHCFITLANATNYARRFSLHDCVIHKVSIPKGALFYKNRTQIVTNRMQVRKTKIKSLL